MLILALLACEPGAAALNDSTTPQDLSAHPYQAQSPDPVDTEALQQAVQASLEQLLELKASPIHASYAQAMTYSADPCPQIDVLEQDGTTTAHWQEVCYSHQTEAWLNGPMTTWSWEGGYIQPQTLPVFDDLYSVFWPLQTVRWEGFGLNGQTDITAPEGVDFNCSCVAMQGHSEPRDGRRYAFVAIDGPTHWTGTAAQDTWLEEDIQLKLSGFAKLQDNGEKGLYLRGSAAGLHPEYSVLEFELPVHRTGQSCSRWWEHGQQQLHVAARDSETGHWVTLELETWAEESCTVCDDSGDFCLDLAPLMDWEELPW